VTCVGGAGGCEEDGMRGGWAPGVRCDEAAVMRAAVLGRVSCLAVLSLAVLSLAGLATTYSPRS
jgi:hypothetical protein